MTDMENMTKNPLFGSNLQQISSDSKTSYISIVELCYHPDTARDVLDVTKKEWSDEGAEFIIACNHVFLQKAGMSSKLGTRLPFDNKGNIGTGLKEIFSRYLADNAPREVNISYKMSKDLKKTQPAICASHEVQALVPARDECAKLVGRIVQRLVVDGNVKASPQFKRIIEAGVSPTDQEVMTKLNAQANNIANFLSSAPTRGRSGM